MAPGKVRLMAKYNPVEFIQEVRQETSKVTWPTWKEVWITTLMVLIMVSVGLGILPHHGSSARMARPARAGRKPLNRS